MTKEYSYHGVRWVDLENPTRKEIDAMIARFSVPHAPAEDILSPTPKQRLLVYDECVYLVLHFPTLSFHKNAFRGDDHRKEIDFILGRDFLITVHYDSMTALEKFSKALKKEKGEEYIGSEGSAVEFFHKLTKNLYHYMLHDVEAVRESLRKAEIEIFKGAEKKMVVELSNIHRDILRFNNALIPHKEAIEALRIRFKEFLGDNAEALIRDIKSEYERVDRRMGNNKALLDELRLTNDSLLSAKQNEAIKGLTMMAFMTFPLSLVAAVFAIHANGTPLLRAPNAFWNILLLMAVILVTCIVYLKKKKWL